MSRSANREKKLRRKTILSVATADNDNNYRTTESSIKPHSARTGRTVFSQLSAEIVRHEVNNGVVYAIRAWFKYDAALSAVV